MIHITMLKLHFQAIARYEELDEANEEILSEICSQALVEYLNVICGHFFKISRPPPCYECKNHFFTLKLSYNMYCPTVLINSSFYILMEKFRKLHLIN